MPQSLSAEMGFDGAEIFLNSTASYHELRKQRRKLRLISDNSRKNGGVYLYSNLRGCDGGRLYFDGMSIIM